VSPVHPGERRDVFRVATMFSVSPTFAMALCNRPDRPVAATANVRFPDLQPDMALLSAASALSR